MKTFVLGLAMVLVMTPSAWAARTAVHDAAESPEYGRKFGGMIGRGIVNVATSFVDVLVNVVNDTKAGPPFVGTLTGLAKGAGCGVLRLGSGAVDLVTFWVPGFNGFPVSDSYDNCLMVSSGQAAASSVEESMAAAERTQTAEPRWDARATSSAAAETSTSPKQKQPLYTK